MSVSLDDQMQALFDAQIEEQKSFDAQFKKIQEDAWHQTASARAAVSKSQQISNPELGELMAILQSNPIIIPSVLDFSKDLLNKLREKMQEVLGPESKNGS